MKKLKQEMIAKNSHVWAVFPSVQLSSNVGLRYIKPQTRFLIRGSVCLRISLEKDKLDVLPDRCFVFAIFREQRFQHEDSFCPCAMDACVKGNNVDG